MKILNFGSCNLDHVYAMDHIVSPGETESTEAFEVFAGGKGLNQSVALAKAGAQVFHAGCLGRDGAMLRDVLEQGGADTSHLRSVDVPNGHAVIQVAANGENAIFLYAGSNAAVCEEQIDEVLDAFDPGDFLLLQNEINLVAQIVRKGAEKGLRIVLNPSPVNAALFEIDVSLLSYLILNEVEAEALCGHADPDTCLSVLRERYPSLRVVLTLGEKGSFYRCAETQLFQPAFRVNVVDTTAAGDTFTGYFLASLAEGRSEQECLRLASAAAALAVSRKGAAPSVPLRDEVLAALPNLKPLEESDALPDQP